MKSQTCHQHSTSISDILTAKLIEKYSESDGIIITAHFKVTLESQKAKCKKKVDKYIFSLLNTRSLNYFAQAVHTVHCTLFGWEP